MATELYKHQQKLISTNPKKHLIAWGTGTGKTIAAIALAKHNNQVPLIVVPKALKEQWEEQIPDDWQVLTKEEFRRDWDKIPGYKAIIYDEFHYWGNYRSQLHKNSMKYHKKHNPEYIYGLTATPFLSTIMNLYAYKLLFGYKEKWLEWDHKYFTRVFMGSRQVPVERKGLQSEVARIVQEIGSTVKLEDCIDMPEQIFETEYYDLTPEQKRAINNLEESNHIVRWTRTHQICGGTLKHGGYEPDQYFATHKLDRIKELATQHDKMVIVCRYNAEVKMIHDALVDKHCPFTITGETKNRHAVVQAAEAASKAIIIVNAACSTGYELPSFPLMVFYSYDFALVSAIQARGRIMRINKPKRNVYLSLVIRNTIDQDVYECIQRKEDFQIEIYKKHE